ncbi:hypothetical protein QYE76_006409 [Lolium multiflorum]|uniref:Reverse transcriptase domain-containing protein n=1 Tax=Lolium multiflorum TaxID=4521 RepID=A0AAD8RVS6_LOLMU|nr:hypothetical protein QYE76_006409 [Lolium multiflorum]
MARSINESGSSWVFPDGPLEEIASRCDVITAASLVGSCKFYHDSATQSVALPASQPFGMPCVLHTHQTEVPPAHNPFSRVHKFKQEGAQKDKQHDAKDRKGTLCQLTPLDRISSDAVIPDGGTGMWAGANGDWIALLGFPWNWELVNVYTGRRIPLPPISEFKSTPDKLVFESNDQHLQLLKIAICRVPTAASNYTSFSVLAIFNAAIAVLHCASSRWTVLDNQFLAYGYSDAIIHKGIVFAVTQTGEVYAWNQLSWGPLLISTAPIPPELDEQGRYNLGSWWLARSPDGSRLFLVHTWGVTDGRDYTGLVRILPAAATSEGRHGRTIRGYGKGLLGCEVYSMDTSQLMPPRPWRRIISLGSYSLFLGVNYPIIIPVEDGAEHDRPNMARSNSVYTSHHAVGLAYPPSPEICRFSLNSEDCTVGFQTNIRWTWRQVPLWLIPSFANARQWNLPSRHRLCRGGGDGHLEALTGDNIDLIAAHLDVTYTVRLAACSRELYDMISKDEGGRYADYKLIALFDKTIFYLEGGGDWRMLEALTPAPDYPNYCDAIELRGHVFAVDETDGSTYFWDTANGGAEKAQGGARPQAGAALAWRHLVVWGPHSPFASFSSRNPSSRRPKPGVPREEPRASRGGEHQRKRALRRAGIRRGNSLPEGEIDAIVTVIELDIISITIIIISTIITAVSTAGHRIAMNEVRKKLFSISLSGKAAHWYKLLKNGDSLDWEDIVPLFYSKFYPPSEIHKDRNRIYNFWPHDGESIAQAWGRLKSLMLKCPIHELPGNVIIDNFYARLSFQDKTLLDTSCSGSFTRNKEEFKRDLLDRIQENTEGWENDKDRESGIIYDYKCIEAFMDTDKFRNMSATYGLDSQVAANLYKAFASHYELPKKNFDKYHEPYKDKIDSSINKCVVVETADHVIPEAYIEKTPFPAKMKEYSVINSAVHKSEKKPVEPEEQIKVEPAVAIVKDLVTENVEDGHIILCEDASNIVSHPNKPKQVSVPMLSVRIGDHCYYGLCDIGASVSAIPYELYTEIMHEIGSCELEDIDVVIHLANRETISPIGIVRDVEVLCEFEEERLLEILKKHRGAIGYTLDDLKGISPSICQHAINMEDDAKPVVEHQRRLIPKMKEVVRNEVLKLLEAGIIYPIADSRWVSPVHCVPKKGGMTVVPNDNDELIPQRVVVGYRMCIDFRKVNKVTKKDHYPLPFIDQMLERLSKNTHFCFLDGYSGFSQIAVKTKDQEKTTFTCPYGTYAYRRMPFGLCNAPATFQRCMSAIFHGFCESIVEVFMDDFSVYGNSFDSCLRNLDKVLQRCEETNLVLNWEKCHFMVNEGIVLGHKIYERGIEVDRAKVEAIEKMPYPRDVKDRKGADNPVADNLSRLENIAYDPVPVNDSFPNEQLAVIKGPLPPALSLDSFPVLEEALRTTDEFCDQYRALRREVEILQEENCRLRRMLEYHSIHITRSSSPTSDNNESLRVLVQNCQAEKLKEIYLSSRGYLAKSHSRLCGAENTREKRALRRAGIRRGNSLPEGEIDAIVTVIELDIISITIIIISTIITAVSTAGHQNLMLPFVIPPPVVDDQQYAWFLAPSADGKRLMIILTVNKIGIANAEVPPDIPYAANGLQLRQYPPVATYVFELDPLSTARAGDFLWRQVNSLSDHSLFLGLNYPIIANLKKRESKAPDGTLVPFMRKNCVYTAYRNIRYNQYPKILRCNLQPDEGETVGVISLPKDGWDSVRQAAMWFKPALNIARSVLPLKKQ